MWRLEFISDWLCDRSKSWFWMSFPHYYGLFFDAYIVVVVFHPVALIFKKHAVKFSSGRKINEIMYMPVNITLENHVISMQVYDVFLLLRVSLYLIICLHETMSGKHHSGISLLMNYSLHVSLRCIFALRISLYLVIFQPELVWEASYMVPIVIFFGAKHSEIQD